MADETPAEIAEGAAAEPVVDEADAMPIGTPNCGPTDGPFVEGGYPAGASEPLTAEQAAYLNKKYPEAAAEPAAPPAEEPPA